MKSIFLLLIKTYKFLISPLLPPSCRFHPSCSQYAEEAISRHGAVKGGWMSVKRIARCNPWNAGGYDPVP
ncbi:MAG: membrane protein insertion efficiency factor YidD [Pseudomonadota bacterium]